MALTRDIGTVGGATLLSRALAFLRDMAIAAVLGAGPLADAFFIALQIPNLFRRLLAEGALNAAFVPLWLRRRQAGGEAAARRFSEDALGALGIALAATAGLCMLFAPALVAVLAPGFAAEPAQYAAGFVRLAAPYLAIVGLVAVLAATLNAAGRVGAAAYGPVAFNLVMIAAAAGLVLGGFGNTPNAGTVLAGAIVAGGILQLLMVGIAATRLADPPRWPRLGASSDVRRFFRMMLPGVIAAGIPQLTLIAGTIVASSSPAAVSWLTYAYRLYELPLGMVSVAIAAVMTPAIAAHVRADDRLAFAAMQARAFELAVGLAVPAALGLVLLAEPIVAALFERGAFSARDSVAVAGALAAIAVGVPGHALEKVLAAVSFAHEDTRTPMLTALIGLAASAASAIVLFPHYGHVGIAVAISACGFVSAALLGIALLRRGWLTVDVPFWRRIALILMATALMGGTVAGLRTLLAPVPSGSMASLVTMTILVLAGLSVYLVALRLFGVAQITSQDDQRR